jgi:hypothetical protein
VFEHYDNDTRACRGIDVRLAVVLHQRGSVSFHRYFVPTVRALLR